MPIANNFKITYVTCRVTRTNLVEDLYMQHLYPASS